MTAVVVGLGNTHRRDDGAGIAVARHVRADAGSDVVVLTWEAPPEGLLDVWQAGDLVFVADAARAGDEPGTIRWYEPGSLPAPKAGRSTHALSLSDAVALGRALGLLPGRLVIVTIEGDEFDGGVGLTAPIEAATRRAAHMILGAVARGTAAVRSSGYQLRRGPG